MVIVPIDSQLEVEAMLSKREIGFVSAGQRAEVKIDNFNSTRYGMLKGKVTGVSQDAIIRNKPPEKAASHNESGSLSSSSEPDGQKLLYSARVWLDRTQMQVEDKLVNCLWYSGNCRGQNRITSIDRISDVAITAIHAGKYIGRVGGDRGDHEQPLGPESHSNCT